MDRKGKRTVIGITQQQPRFDFEEAAHSPEFTFPEYQRGLLVDRLSAGVADFVIIGAVFGIFVSATYFQMPEGFRIDRRMVGIYAAGFLLLAVVYFLLFMLSSSQTPGMKLRGLTVVARDETPLDPPQACLRGLGYLISFLPLMLGFVWALIDPEHLTWADKVSGTYVKRL
jgi:uncharacterized RDD family membrane protein YckC